MQVKQKTITIEKLIERKGVINLNPIWQRGPAWKRPRQVLLIDSILRGMDIPKLYLRKLPKSNAHEHDAVDGQQRMRAIFEYKEGVYQLTHDAPLPPVGAFDIDGKTYAQLDKSLREKFDSFILNIAEITEASSDEITNLFSRLQMGVALNPAELRNAMLTPLRHVIDSVAREHEFFLNSKISDDRSKRQDYSTHAFAMAAYQGTRNIKAQDLKLMVSQYAHNDADKVLELSATVGDALNVLAEVNDVLGAKITQKWIFVDLCWLIMQWQADGLDIDTAVLAEDFEAFEALRRQYLKRPEDLINANGVAVKQARLNRHLYDYIVAFRAQGATHANLKIRNNALKAYCR